MVYYEGHRPIHTRREGMGKEIDRVETWRQTEKERVRQSCRQRMRERDRQTDRGREKEAER